MNKNISERTIEIGGKQYTLFLNRTGIVNWEKLTHLSERSERYTKMAEELASVDEAKIADDADPFALFEQDNLDEQLDEMFDIYAKFYWVALYKHHRFSISRAKELFDKAVEEYGIEQMGELANQMIEDANSDLMAKKRKNLKALRPTKKN